MGFQMNLESNHVTAFFLVLDGFLIVSKKCWLISIRHFLFLIIGRVIIIITLPIRNRKVIK